MAKINFRAAVDDRTYAVAAGLAVVEAVPKLDIGPRATLRVRIGIATGLVVGVDLLGEGVAAEQAVIGELPIWLRGFRRWPNRIRWSSMLAPAAS